jgi:hypothetical protein
VHVLCFGVLFHELLLFHLGKSGPLSKWMVSWVLTSGQIATVAIWALLSGRVWLAAARVREASR